MRQRREPAALARDGTTEGAVGAAGARRHARAAGAAAPDRKPSARRRSAARSALLVGRWGQQLLPGTPGQASPLDWRVLAFVIAVTTVTGVVFGIAPALRATRDGRQRRHSRRTAGACSASRSLLGRIAGRRAGRHLAGAARRRRIVPPHAAEPPAGRRRIQSAERAAVPGQPDAEPIRRPESQRSLYDQIGERLRAIAGVRSVAWSNTSLMSGRRFSARHLRPGPHLSTGPARHHLRPRRLADVFRHDGDSAGRRPRLHARATRRARRASP